MAGFKHMMKKMGMVEFNKYCAQLAAEYGKSESKYTGEYFANREGISDDCFWDMLDHAVVHYLVEDWVVNLMESKASGNQAEFDGSGMKSLRHYEKLREQRRAFAFRFARDFARSEGESIADFVEKYGVEAKKLQSFLERIMEKSDYFGITPDMASTIQFRIFFELVPYLMAQDDK